MKKWWLYVSLSCFLLSACDTNLSKQALREAEEALLAQNYQKAKGLIRLASTESSNSEYEALYDQCVALTDMMNHLAAGEFDESLLSWTDLNLIATESTLIKEAAVTELKQVLQQVITLSSEALETHDIEEAKSTINHLIKRLGDIPLFEDEMTQLQQLRQQME